MGETCEAKRFGLKGCEALLPALWMLTEKAVINNHPVWKKHMAIFQIDFSIHVVKKCIDIYCISVG